MTAALVAGSEAQRLVRCAYGALDLFAGRRDELLAWAGGLSAAKPAAQLAPSWWAAPTRAALVDHLTEARIANIDGTVDAYRLAVFQQVVELLPHFQDAELARLPAPKPKVVFTLPPGAKLPDRAKDLARRTLAVRVLTALGSADTRTLLASPFWSDQGAENLWDGLLRSVELDVPITLAGAKRDPEGKDDHLPAMLRLAARLRDAGATRVAALRYQPLAAKAWGLFHGKLVCGLVGYLGSANLTGSGLGEHVEAGIPLDPVDVEHVWWLLEVLVDAQLLVSESF